MQIALCAVITAQFQTQMACADLKIGEKTMAEYIEREALRQFPIRKDHYDKKNGNEHFIFGIETVMEYAESLPSADVAPVQKWISVKDRLPEPEQEVIVCCKSQISNSKYVCCAFYVPENWLRESSQFSWDYECCDEYDEEQDDYVVKKGWYESIHNWDEYSVIGIDDAVTHWMPLQEPPKEE